MSLVMKLADAMNCFQFMFIKKREKVSEKLGSFRWSNWRWSFLISQVCRTMEVFISKSLFGVSCSIDTWQRGSPLDGGFGWHNIYWRTTWERMHITRLLWYRIPLSRLSWHIYLSRTYSLIWHIYLSRNYNLDCSLAKPCFIFLP